MSGYVSVPLNDGLWLPAPIARAMTEPEGSVIRSANHEAVTLSTSPIQSESAPIHSTTPSHRSRMITTPAAPDQNANGVDAGQRLRWTMTTLKLA